MKINEISAGAIGGFATPFFKKRKKTNEAKDTKYGIIRYPDTAISYIKNDGNGWEHIYDKSYGFKGPVDKADLKHASKIAKEKIPSRMFEITRVSRDVKNVNNADGSKSFSDKINTATKTGARYTNMTSKVSKDGDYSFSNTTADDKGNFSLANDAGFKTGYDATIATALKQKKLNSSADEDLSTCCDAPISDGPGDADGRCTSCGEVVRISEALTEEQFDEKAGEKDACYHKVKSRYKVWPSAYASGALVKCRKVGAANWGKSKGKK